MKIIVLSLIPSLLMFACIHSCMNIHFVRSQCLDNQKSLLLELKSSVDFDPSMSTKLVQWDPSTDCCQWSGVACDNSTGQVLSLDLSNDSINGGINSSSSLFRLQSLTSLNLANNYMFGGEVPSAVGKLSSLTYLNLSGTGYSGDLPIEISYLEKLVVLDLSGLSGSSITDLATIFKNMTNIRELYLDYISILDEGKQWGEALSSSLPHLQVLSMSSCNLTGEIPQSLAKLQSLSVLCLGLNHLSGSVPEFLAGFRNLTILALDNCEFTGAVPHTIFQNPTLLTLDLSYNIMLQGTLPDFPKNTSLETIELSFTKISGSLPTSISNLKMLRTLNLGDCDFHGIIPPSIESLNKLEYLNLYNNKFSGQIPSFSRLKNLKGLRLMDNSLTGSITTTYWGGLPNLESINLSNNSLSGSLPTSLFSVPPLRDINLARNKFSGQLHEFEVIPSSILSSLDLSRNQMEGQVPKSISLYKGLVQLNLSWNRFNGTLDLNEILLQLQNITTLDLSHNRLSVNTHRTVVNLPFPQLNFLYLGSCNLQVVPEFLKNQTNLVDLDLSDNQIQGRVPSWVWEVGSQPLGVGFFRSLNLSFNRFSDLEPLTYIPSLTILDLHSNNLQGQVPAMPSQMGLNYLDFSNNSFTSINPEIGKSLSLTIFFSVSRNNIYGSIPTSLCNATKLEVLELEYNHLNGTLPDCLIGMTQRNLAVLTLRRNNFHGSIPDVFGDGCKLQTLDFNGNFLQGQIPPSLDNCKKLKVLDLGNNRLNGTFPCQLRSLSDLQVLILRSNKFHGTVACQETHATWPLLQIVDLASNNFSGELMPHMLLEWTAMMAKPNEMQTKHLQYVENMVNVYYQDAVALTLKGSVVDLPKILSIFTSIDLSDNAFHGVLPGELENLRGVFSLNLSHNSFSGNIPSSIGNLSQLESLDLSWNALSGSIPQQLANLNFLSFVNLSHNNLTGEIPTSTQLQSFLASSYIGNPGLCGPPLPLSCRSKNDPAIMQDAHWTLDTEMEWVLSGAEIGFPVGMAVIIGPLLYSRRYRKWVDRLAMLILSREDRGR